MPEFKDKYSRNHSSYNVFSERLFGISQWSPEWGNLFSAAYNKGFDTRFDFADRVNNLLCSNGFEELV